jgi:hypothetical protein
MRHLHELRTKQLENSFGKNYRFRSFKNNSVRQYLVENWNKRPLGSAVLNEATTQEERFSRYDL